MGLDNGLILHSKTRNKLLLDDIPAQVRKVCQAADEDSFAYGDQYHVTYWRRCYGLREEMVNLLMNNTDPVEIIEDGFRTFTRTNKDFGYYLIYTQEQLLKVIECIASWLDPVKWNLKSRSPWDAKQMRQRLIGQIITLSSIYTLMGEDSDWYLEFYDSY